MNKIISVLDKIAEYAIYGLVFIIPFSKAGIEIFAITAISAWSIKKIISFKKGLSLLPHTPLNIPLFALFAIYIISMIFSCDINESMEGVFFKLAEYVALFFVCANIFSDKEKGQARLETLLKFITASVALLFMDALFQWITGKDFIRKFEIGRLRACFATSNDFAGYLIAILPLFFCAILVKFKSVKSRFMPMANIAYSILFIIGFVMLCATLSRGAWIGYLSSMAFLLVALFLYETKIRKKIPANITSLIFILILLAVSIVSYQPVRQRVVSARLGLWGSAERFYRWREAVTIIEDFPIIGTGPNTYTKASSIYNKEKQGFYAHNSYLQMAAEVGIAGLFIFLLVIFRFFYAIIKYICSIPGKISSANGVSRNRVIFLLGISSGILATLIQSFFDTNLYALRLITLFWVMLGVGTALIVRE